MLLIKCDKCNATFWVKGYIIPDGWTEPGEVVIDEDATLPEDACEHYHNGTADYSIEKEDHEYFDDDVI